MPATHTTAHTPSPRSSPLHYEVAVADLHAHLFEVTLRIEQPRSPQRVSLPVWIPGSYLVREFARHLQQLSAHQGGQPVTITQDSKHSWLIHGQAGQPLLLRWQVYAFDTSVRSAWLDTTRGFFNGTSLFLQVEHQTDRPHVLRLRAPPKPCRWRVATGLSAQRVDTRGFGTYLAADYDELVDCPVEMGDFWTGEFKAAGVPHQLVVAGATASFDGQRLLTDTRAICETAIRFWHGKKKPPHRRYVFLLNAVDDGYGGLEHRNSTALLCNRRDLPRLGEVRAGEGYTTLLGLISHEYFHTWNVKRLRPVEFTRYDYSRENYTQLLWFFEGVTSYYDDLLLRRAGLLDNAAYLKLLNKTLNQVQQTPGRHVQSAAQASMDAWVKYYRPDENTANVTVSYYTKGALIALCLDLCLRTEQPGNPQATLDEVMRRLWARCKAGPMTEADVAAVLTEVGGRSYAHELQDWVHGTHELPLQALLTQHGVSWHDDPAQWAQRLGLRITENNGTLLIKQVLHGGTAQRAGLAANDEWVGLACQGSIWRLSRLDDVPLYAGPERHVVAWVVRDKRFIQLPMTLPEATTTIRLALQDNTRCSAWLG